MVAFLLFLMAASVSIGNSEEDSEESSIDPAYYQYKVEALNTALYYILEALHEDLQAGMEVDTSFLKRVKVIANKIKYFNGKIDETNALMIGEILRTFSRYLGARMEEAGVNFDEYTIRPSTVEKDTTNLAVTTTNAENTEIIFSDNGSDNRSFTDGEDIIIMST